MYHVNMYIFFWIFSAKQPCANNNLTKNCWNRLTDVSKHANCEKLNSITYLVNYLTPGAVVSWSLRELSDTNTAVLGAQINKKKATVYNGKVCKYR